MQRNSLNLTHNADNNSNQNKKYTGSLYTSFYNSSIVEVLLLDRGGVHWPMHGKTMSARMALHARFLRNVTMMSQYRPVVSRVGGNAWGSFMLLNQRGMLGSVSRSILVQNDKTPVMENKRTRIRAFKDLDLGDEVLKAVEELGFEDPTEIQTLVIPKLIHDRNSDFAVASHTGSGKTLAYLLPILHALKEAEAVDGIPVKPRRPRAIVLGPTRELVEQIYSVAKSLTRIAKCRSVVLTGGGEMSTQKAALGRGVDLLIATPGKVVQHSDRGNLFYGDVEVVVLDEADTMMDRGFGPEVEKILSAVQKKPQRARCILVSATMTKQVKHLVSSMFPKIRHVETSTLHKGVSGSRHTFLPAKAGVDKLDVTMQLLESDYAKKQHTIVFCNTLDSCRAVEHYLSEQGIPTVCYHGDVPVSERKIAIASFSSESSDHAPPILVATDLAARGLDIPGRVDHVVNFDFPLNPVDYLHRTGRTGRAGAKGKITSLVGKGDQTLAMRIEEALGKGLPLDSLSADKSVLPPHMRPKPETLKMKALEKKAKKHSKSGGSFAKGGGTFTKNGGRSGQKTGKFPARKSSPRQR